MAFNSYCLDMLGCMGYHCNIFIPKPLSKWCCWTDSAVWRSVILNHYIFVFKFNVRDNANILYLSLELGQSCWCRKRGRGLERIISFSVTWRMCQVTVSLKDSVSSVIFGFVTRLSSGEPRMIRPWTSSVRMIDYCSSWLRISLWTFYIFNHKVFLCLFCCLKCKKVTSEMQEKSLKNLHVKSSDAKAEIFV